MKLDLSQKQLQTLSPQMIQSMEILQMGSQELLEYIEEVAQENPVLEVEEGRRDEEQAFFRKLEWLEATDPHDRYYQRQDSEEQPLAEFGSVNAEDESLYSYAMGQLEQLRLPEAVMELAVFLLKSLDRRGWLDESVEQVAALTGRSAELVQQALAAVQSLDPAGIGARDLSECLQLQLRRRWPEDALALTIARDHLDALAKGHYGHISKATGACQEAVRAACDRIRGLDPRPGVGFAAPEEPVYITPDVIVVRVADGFELLTNDCFFPNLNISSYYTRMLKEHEEAEVKEYLGGKVRQAKWVVQSIQQRRSTLLQCAQCILEMQEAFFRKGPGHLVPMTLADVAQQAGIHESTVSRAIKDKYLQCDTGVYPMSSFFSRSLGTADANGEQASADQAKALLRQLVEGEDKRKPLSDQKLCEQMAAQGCILSRRTVAKYRDELGIPSTTGRRAYP